MNIDLRSIIRTYRTAEEAEKKAQDVKDAMLRKLRNELNSYKKRLIKDGPIKFKTPLTPVKKLHENDTREIIGVFYDDSFKGLFPEGRVRIMVAENGKFNINQGVYETFDQLAEVLSELTQY